MAHKLIEAVKEAVQVARCDHDLQPLPDHLSPAGYSRTLCKKCGASFYKPTDTGSVT